MGGKLGEFRNIHLRYDVTNTVSLKYLLMYSFLSGIVASKHVTSTCDSFKYYLLIPRSNPLIECAITESNTKVKHTDGRTDGPTDRGTDGYFNM